MRQTMLFALVILVPVVADANPGSGQAHQLGWDRLGVWSGYRLAGQRIEQAFVSEGRPLETAKAWQRVIETDIAGSSRMWNNRCVLTHRGMYELDLSCTFAGAGLEPASLTLVHRGRGGHGRILGPVHLQVAGNLFNLEVFEFTFADLAGDETARWQVESLLRARAESLRFAEHATALERELLAVIVLTAQLIDVEEMARAPSRTPSGGVLDAYLLRTDWTGATRAELQRHAEQLLALGAPSHAALLREHARANLAIDRRSGPLILRKPSTPRIFGGLHGGVTATADPDGAPQGIGGGSIEVVGGVRLHNLSIQLDMGLLPGVVDHGSLASAAGVTGVDSAAFSLGLQMRYMMLSSSTIELFIGASAALRLRFVDVVEWGATDGALQVGVAVAPRVGLQTPLWRLNDLGSRVLLYAEFVPEWSFYSSPNVTGPVGTEVAQWLLQEALEGRELSLRMLVGLRFEL